jgi:hypothetical protein
VTDSGTPPLFDEKTITITVTEVNQPPVLAGVPAAATVPELVLYTFTATATDPDSPAQTLTFSLVGAPAGAAIGPASGVFTWTPTEAQGPGTYPFTVRVSDGVANTGAGITITVTEVNIAPTLSGVPAAATIPEMAPYTFTATATDPDVPAQTLTFSLGGAPAGAAIGPASGIFTWTPTEAQGPGTYPFTVRVSDGVANADAGITITVTEVNQPPVLAGVPAAATIPELVPYSFTATATDPDSPAQTLTFSLVGAPAGASIDGGSGVFTWTPTEAQGPGTHSFKVRATDSFNPGAFDEKPITISVGEVNTAPVLTVPGPQTVDEGNLLGFTVSASDPDQPANPAVTLSASNLPLGAAFNSGTFSWKPTSAQGGPNPYFVQFTVSDGQFTDTKVVSIAVNDTIADGDGDGIPDAVDNCPDQFNPDQVNVCSNSPEAVTADATISPTPPTGPIDVVATFTFTAGAPGTYVVRPNRFNVICRVTSHATLQELQWQTVPEGLPIVLSTASGDLASLPASPFVTTFDLRDWYPILAPGSYTVVCTYVNFAHIPAPEADDPIIWMGTVDAPPQTILVGLSYTFSGFSSPADHEPFNRGRTVPVKFELRDSTGALVTNATPRLFVQRIEGGELVGPRIPATPTGGGTGNTVPFDGTEYHYNMKTDSLAVGEWQLQAQLGDGTIQVITIIIR